MKYLLIIVFLFPLLLMGQSGNTLVKFDKVSIDLGEIIRGQKIKNEFIFTNISDEDVLIDLVSTCDCTEAKWTTSAIKPGEKGKISFLFDSNKKEAEEIIEVDVYFVNIDPITENPISVFLNYTYSWAK